MSDHGRSGFPSTSRGPAGVPSVRLVLLDRDGVINQDSPDFIRTLDEWMPIPGAIDAISRLKHHEFLVGICTNQSGVGRGLLTEATLADMHGLLQKHLLERNAGIDAWRYCPHLPDSGCECRKPRPGMLLDLMRALGVDAQQTCFVGDSLRDMEAARAAGCEGVLVRTGHGRSVEAQARLVGVVRVYDDLSSFADAQIESLQHRIPRVQQ